MTAYSAMTVYIASDFGSTIHLAKVNAEGLYVPRCGTRTRVKDLTVANQSLAMIDCERCQKIMRKEGVQ